MDFDFIATADLHITDQIPNKRTKDYPEILLGKLEQILEITKKHTHSNLLLVAGDFFDSPTVSYDITREVIKILKKHNVKIVVVPGQHDIRYHQSGLKNTPLGILVESDLIKIHDQIDPGIACSGWNEEPKVETPILLTHRMVINKEKIFFDQQDFISAKDLLKKYPWAKIIISGDNHTPHLVKYKGRVQLNCGSIVRKTKAQIDYKPAVWAIKMKPEIKVKKIPLNIKPSKEVFDFYKIEKEEIEQEIKKDAQEKIDKFLKVLPDIDKKRPNFPLILQKVIKETNPNKRVQKIVNDIMETIS